MLKQLSSQGKLSFAEFIKSLLMRKTEDGHLPQLHFFKQDYTYACYDIQAQMIADEFYHTRFSIKHEHGFDVLNIHKKFFQTICNNLIANYQIHIWHKKSSEPNSSWDLLAIGRPGNVLQLEDAIGGFGNSIDGVFMSGDYHCVLYCTKASSTQFSQIMFTYVNKLDNKIVIAQFEDVSRYDYYYDYFMKITLL
jgi:hypothetical protein